MTSATLDPLPVRRTATAALYAVVFFYAVPSWLWHLGLRIDALAALPRVPRLASLGWLAVLAGGALIVASAASLSLLAKAGGPPSSRTQGPPLVTEGAYAYLRHPIYVGYNLAFAGAGLVVGSLGVAIGSGLLLAVGWLSYALAYEEPRLAERHGHAFDGYAARVPIVPGARECAATLRRAWRSVLPAVEALANRPVLARIGPTQWVSFGSFCALGAAVAVALFDAELVPVLGEHGASGFAFGVCATTLAGCWLAARFQQPTLWLQDPREALQRAGLVSWGGYASACVFIAVFGWLGGVSAWMLLDRVFTASLLCSFFGRIGCLSYGCCYGRPARDGVCWYHPDSKVVRELGAMGSVPRAPTQLLSAVHVLAIFALVWPVRERLAPGAATGIIFLLYAVGRFSIEWLRDETRYTRFALTRGQLAAVATFAIAQLVLFRVQPGVGGPGSVPWPLVTAPSTWRVALVCGVLVFGVSGLHRRAASRW
jgi:prolipoprotein diacylglyceryltransferase/protein-S-isoprenylcysteine O-methyltransferase Ste14